jgi:hypothetical protein
VLFSGPVTPAGNSVEDLEGHVDRVENGWLLGWAWDRRAPTATVSIDVLEADQLMGRVAADLFRADLTAAGKGDGRHAFQWKLPPHASELAGREIRIRFSGTDQDLVGSPVAVTGGARPGREPAPVEHAARYRSAFGGLWPDLSNARAVIRGKEQLGWISPDEARLLREWVANGFVVLPAAAPLDRIDALDREIEAVWAGTSPHQYFVEFWQDDRKILEPAGPAYRDRNVKLLDVHMHSADARELIFCPPILRLLAVLFERPALAFQTLYFRWGSQQAMHQDSTFVRVSSPMELVASWIALQDVERDSGELEYYAASHLLDDFLFEGSEKWMPFQSDDYTRYVESLHERSVALGLDRVRFRPKRGDILLWSANLVHGGSEDVRSGVTRKSLVTHYCPTDCWPLYGSHAHGEQRTAFSEWAYYSSGRA